jgi:hypothetical protein
MLAIPGHPPRISADCAWPPMTSVLRLPGEKPGCPARKIQRRKAERGIEMNIAMTTRKASLAGSATEG